MSARGALLDFVRALRYGWRNDQPGRTATLGAPGIAGVAVITNLSRVMFAVGRLKVAAAGLAGSWLLVMAAEATLALLAPSHLVVAALALGSTIGQTAVAIPMVIATRRAPERRQAFRMWQTG